MTYRDSNAYDDEGLGGAPSEPRIIITSVGASRDAPPEDAPVFPTYNPEELGEKVTVPSILSKAFARDPRTASTADTLRAGYDPYTVWRRLCRD